MLGPCSSRYHKETFDFGKQTLVARAPLREYVAWTQPHQTEDTQMRAADYLRMHVAGIKMQEAPVPVRPQTEKTLLVVGGGVTGMTAALEAARTGYPVHLVEKEPRLGGFALALHRRTPSASPFHSIQSAAPDELVCATESHHGTTVHRSSRVVSISGQPGDFTVVLTGSAGETTVRVGAIELATGGKPDDASRLTHLGIAHDNVGASVEFEAMAASGRIVRKDSTPADSVAFIQCAGSRDANHLPYCSSFCCTTSLKQAGYVRAAGGDRKAYVIYRDMITPGQYENFYRATQSDPGIFLTKGDVAGVHENPDKSVTVDVDGVEVNSGAARTDADAGSVRVQQAPDVDFVAVSPSNMVTRWGYSEKLGPLAWQEDEARCSSGAA